MKKIFALAAFAVLFGGAVFADENFAASTALEAMDSYQDSKTQDITVEDKYPELHPKAKKIDVRLEYTPLTGEVKLFYTCTQSSFEEGEAMNVAMAVYDDFGEEHKYKHKRYVAKDKKKYFKDERGVRMVEYSSYVIFTK